MAIRHNSRGLVIPGLLQSGGSSANWWEVDGETCVAAYQPIGAASLAASYVNLANPGTYDAAPGTAPTFDTATGWTFLNTSSQYLTTGITSGADKTWSLIVRFSNCSGANRCAVGAYTSATRQFRLLPRSTGAGPLYANGGQVVEGAEMTAGIMAVAGNKGYRDGSPTTGSISTGTDGGVTTIYIGRETTNYFTGDIQAVAIYSTTLDAAQVAALTTIMAALS